MSSKSFQEIEEIEVKKGMAFYEVTTQVDLWSLGYMVWICSLKFP